MRAGTEEQYLALQKGSMVARDFIWFQVRDRDTGAPVYDGYWSDVGTIDAQVIDAATGGTTVRSYAGGFGLIKIGDIPFGTELTVQSVTVTLAQCSARVNDLMRGYDCKQGIVEIHRGIFDPDTRKLVGPAVLRFLGFIDKAPIKTPPAGEEGDVTLTCVEHTQELMKSNPATRSLSDQLERTAPLYDDFHGYANVVGEWTMRWGTHDGPVPGINISDAIKQVFS